MSGIPGQTASCASARTDGEGSTATVSSREPPGTSCFPMDHISHALFPPRAFPGKCWGNSELTAAQSANQTKPARHSSLEHLSTMEVATRRCRAGEEMERK